jgi:hypothetical protein
MPAMHCLRRAAVVILLLAPSVLAQGKNLLFYGNSLSFFNGGVARLVQAMAVEAGFPAPVYQERLVSGQDLHFHATDPGQVAAIGNFLPAGQHWDVVIMQGISTEATQALGHPAQFVSDAITIMGNVRSHSPAAKGVLYQTWARGAGHSYYPTYWPNPLAMHEEVRTNYRNAVPALQAVYGAGSVVNSAAGDCAALLEFDPSYYIADLQHPRNQLTVMASMCLFTSIYSQRVGDITPQMNPPSQLGALLNSLLLTGADWRRMAGIADSCAAPAVRRYPGSADQLLLETASQPGLLTGVSREALTIGNVAQVRISSRNGIYDAAPAFLLATLFVTGQPPMPTLLPEVAVDPNAMGVLVSAPDLQSPLTLSVPMSFTLPGVSVLVQGLAWAPSAETGNAWFTTTEGHVFEFY